MNPKYLGLAVMFISVLLAYNVYILSSELLSSLDHGDECSSFETCPHVQTATSSYTGYAGATGTFLIGLYIFLRQPTQPVSRKKKPSDLNPDEIRVYDIVEEAGGMIFQSEIVEKTSFPKARVTRVLDRLESRNVLERRRRGMTNAVMLK